MADVLAANLRVIQRRIHDACVRAGRVADEVTLVCVSKTRTAPTIRAAHDAGGRDFGENYAQHLRDKHEALVTAAGLRWHFIGRLQRNKVKFVVGTAALIHTVDRPAIVEAIERRAASAGGIQDVLVQLNLSGEESKSGCSVDELDDLLRCFAQCSHVRCTGLMTMPPFSTDPELSRPVFRRLRQIRDEARAELAGVELRQLSMGMSGDFEVAVEEGATLVRVGTAIFGPRER